MMRLIVVFIRAGTDRFFDNIHEMTGHKFGMTAAIIFKYVTPILITVSIPDNPINPCRT